MKYMIPKNVKTSFEFMEGFGWKELFITTIGTIIGGILFFIGTLLNAHIFLRLILLAVTAGGAFFLSKSDPKTNKSPLDFIKDVRDFNKRQRVYYYNFGAGRVIRDRNTKR